MITQTDYLTKHLPHRYNLLIAFRQRYSSRHPGQSLDPERFRDLYRCAFDISMLMARFFCKELGLRIKKGEQDITDCSPEGAVYGATAEPLARLLKRRNAKQLREVLIAANRAVAHIEPSAVDHSVNDQTLIEAIDLVDDLVREHIYGPHSPVTLNDALSLENNRM